MSGCPIAAVYLPSRDKRGADVRPDFNWDKKPVRIIGYR
jgi:hypothetical protein